MNQEEIKSIRNLAKTNIEIKSHIALETYKTSQNKYHTFASFEACAKTDWFLLDVMEKLSRERSSVLWLR